MRLLPLIACLVFACASLSMAQETAEPAFDRPLIFGMNPIWAGWTKKDPETWEPAMFDKVKESGAKVVRIGIGWDWIERERGVLTFDHNDRHVDMAIERGLEVVGLWVGSATYATSSPYPEDRERNDLGRWMPKEENAEDFMRVTRAVAEHYKDRITMWEFWNEANHMGMKPWPAQTADYAPWLRRAYQGLKAGNPNAVVGTTGMDGCDTRFLGELYEMGYGDSFDAVVVHPYSSVGIDAAGLIAIRNQMIEHGDEHKPVWITEFGWGIEPHDPNSVEMQAENIRRSYDVLLRPDFDFVTVATFHTICDFDPTGSQYYGLSDIDLNPRPAFFAYQECVARKQPRPESIAEALPVHETLRNANFADADMSGWTTYGRSDGHIGNGEHGMVTPDGSGIWGAVAAWDVKYGGIKQRVQAQEGQAYRAAASIFTASRGGDADNVMMRIGIDPHGNADPVSPTVVWSEWDNSDGAWGELAGPPVPARADSVTVFLEHRHSWGLEWNQTCADWVRLEPIEEK